MNHTVKALCLKYCPNWTKTKFKFSPVGHYNPCEENKNKK